MSLLGVDFGKRYIGLAISQGLLAEPLKTLENSKNVTAKIGDIIREYDCERIVIGLPEGILEREVQEFGRHLEKQFKVPVSFVSEIYTTKEAQGKLLKTTRQKKRRRVIHAAAAALILESYIRNDD